MLNNRNNENHHLSRRDILAFEKKDMTYTHTMRMNIVLFLYFYPQERGESDPAAILTSASMRMSLTLMGALRATVPGLFASMAQTLMDLFGASAPFALGQVGSGAGEQHEGCSLISFILRSFCVHHDFSDSCAVLRFACAGCLAGCSSLSCRAVCMVALRPQVDSSSAYLETLSQVREVAQRVAAADSGSPKDERAQVRGNEGP